MERHSFCKVERNNFRKVSGELPELCGDCPFPQRFHTWKLNEMTVIFAVIPKMKYDDDEPVIYFAICSCDLY